MPVEVDKYHIQHSGFRHRWGGINERSMALAGEIYVKIYACIIRSPLYGTILRA